MEQKLLLNYELNYNSNIPYQSQGVSNQLMLAQSGKTGDYEEKNKRKNKNSKKT